MRSIPGCCLVYCLLMVSASGQDQSPLPEEVQTAIKSNDARISKLTEAAAAESEKQLEKVLADLKKLQVSLTKRALLDEAVAVRNCLMLVQNASGIDARRASLERNSRLLHEEAAELVENYLKSSAAKAEQNSKALEAARTQKNDQLQPLFEKYTESGDLDVSIAIRDAMKVEASSATPAAVAVEKLQLSADPAEARKQHETETSKLRAEHAKQLASLVEQHLPKLKTAQDKESKASRLDEAVKVRDLIRSLTAEKVPTQQIKLLTETQATASETAAAAIKEMLDKAAKVEAQLGADLTRYDQALAAVIASEVAQVVLNQDAETARAAISQYYFLKRDMEQVAFLHRADNTPISDEKAGELLEKFADARDERMERAQEAESALRASLIEELNEIDNSETLSDEARDNLARVTEFASADYSDGLQAMRLLRTPPSLPDNALMSLGKYRESLKSTLTSLTEAHRAACQELAEAMKPIVKRRVAAGEFAEAYQLKARLPALQKLPVTIPVKVARQAYSDHLWDGHVIDVKGENTFLVSFGHGNEEWMPRSRLKFAPDDVVVVADMRKQEQPEGPGVAVKASTKLKRGQHAFKFWGSTWYPVTIDDVSSQEVNITWDGWSGRKEACQRSELRLMEEE